MRRRTLLAVVMAVAVLGIPAIRPAGADSANRVPIDASSTDIGLVSGFQDTQLGHLERGRALVAADFNLDGRMDFYVGNPGDDSYVMVNVDDGGGSFHFDVAQVLFTGNLAWGATAFDYDNDGDPDLF